MSCPECGIEGRRIVKGLCALCYQRALYYKSREGQTNRKAKLTEADVIRIRSKERDVSDRQRLADELGVSPSAVQRAYVGKSWCHI